jgi:hypothetical protein
MNDYQLDDNAKKDLTIYLGEKWHEKAADVPDDGVHPKKSELCSCGAINCEWQGFRIDFTTEKAMVDLAKKMEKWQWDAFEIFAYDVWKDPVMIPHENFIAWLITDPQRFCYLVYASGVWR